MSTEVSPDVGHTSENRLPPWPLRWRALGAYALAFGSLVAIGLVVGFLITGPLSDSGLVRLDHDLARWWAERRTPDLNGPSDTGSALANTFNIIGAVILLVGLLTWRLKSWKESLTLGTALALEASVFLVVSTVVGRSRPPVDRLDASPATASFPSGHTGAAFAFYLGIALIVWWRSDAPWIRVSAIALGLAAAVTVAVSRMYRGMHYLTDVTMGALLGTACLAIAAVIVQRAIERRSEENPS
jgi:membrane-associated phospholipid phosphatase